MLNKLSVKYFTLLIFLGVILLSCSDKKNSSLSEEAKINADTDSEHTKLENTKSNVSLKEFVSWCSNPANQLNKSKDISELKYSLIYMPMETMAFLELRNQQYDYSKFQKTCGNYSEMTYFNLRIELTSGNGELIKYNLKTPAQYEERVRYTSFGMQNDIYLVQGNDTLRPGLYQSERIFEVAPYMIASFGFDNKKFDNKKEITIVLNDQLFEKGFIKFNYKNGQLIDMPTITVL